jgi:hypothetical protein
MYDTKKFDSAVKYYETQFLDVKKKSIFIIFDIENKPSFYSIAPLSRALHNLKKDVFVYSPPNWEQMNTLSYIWNEYPSKNKLLTKFISLVQKKAGKDFSKIFSNPLIINAEENYFNTTKNTVKYQTSWLKKRKWNLLLKTSSTIWTQVFNVKGGENIGMTFSLIPKEKDLSVPLSDYLDSYQILDAMYEEVKSKSKSVGIKSSTARYSMNDFPEHVSDLIMTLTGCEYEKEIKEEPFITFKEISKKFGTSCFNPEDINFGIYGIGVHVRHIFGETIGYPTPNLKTKWTSPRAMMFKFSWSPQSKHDSRDPVSRIGFTDTLPIEIFIETCNIDWHLMSRKNKKITKILDSCEKVVVEGKKSNFTVGLVGKDKRRHAMNSDIDIREKIDTDYYKRTGMKTGTMANLPGGESFVTPEWIEGIICGDVVIHIDDNYILDKKEPIIIQASKEGYKIVSGPKKILSKIKEKKKEAWAKIIEYEKKKVLPKEVIEMKKANFNKFGEFAINTNPKAKLCNYLIVNEKIANMMHVALGSGFDPDRSTEYHYDIVFDSKNQKLDVYGVSGGKRMDILKKGKFVI